MKNTKPMKNLSLLLATIVAIAMLCTFALTASAADTDPACTEHTDAGYVVIDLESKNTDWTDDTIYESSYNGYTATFLGDHYREDMKSIESEAIMLSPGEEYVLEFDWGINQYFIDYGEFIMRFYHNGDLVLTRDYTTEPCEIVETIAHEFLASEDGDTFRWEFEKTSYGFWADDGRTAYLGVPLVTTTGNVCSDILTCINCAEEFVAVNQIVHDPAIELNEDGVCPNPNCHTYEEMTLVTEDNYEALGLKNTHIGYSAVTKIGHLYLIAHMTSGGNNAINAVLVNDIDLSEHRNLEIGNAKNEFGGIFDGNGKTITLALETATSNSGLFKYIKNATIKNLTVDGTLNVKNTVSGGIVGAARGDNTISNCISKVDTVSVVNGDGTHSGIVGVNDGNLVILNSAFVGSIIGENAYNNGGIVGWTVDGKTATIRDSYIYATLSTNTEGCDIIGRNPYRYTVENTYYINNAYGYGGYSQAIEADAEKFESGEVAYLLGEAWGQNIGTDAYPVFATETNKVYYGYVSCASGAEQIYTNNSNAAVIKPKHEWIPLEGICAVCGESVIPEFEFPTKPYLTEDELNIPVDYIRAYFKRSLDVKYEDGKYMIEDIGASSAEIFFADALTYENGYWVIEMSEETYNEGDITINFSGKNDSWYMLYNDGEYSGNLQMSVNYNEYNIIVYMNSDWIDVAYPVLDQYYADSYRNGELKTHTAKYYFENSNDFFEVEYNADKTVKNVMVHSGQETDDSKYYVYLSPDGIWYTNPYFSTDYLTDAPMGYEDAGLEYFLALAPAIIGCTHESLTVADCINAASCLICGVIPEGSEPLGHNTVIDKAVEPTCTEYGYTEGSHCSRCGDVMVVQEPIDPINHDWDEGEVTTDPTCSAMGKTTYTCKNDANHIKTETDVEIDTHAHAWDEGEVIVASTCVEMGRTLYTCTHDNRHIKIKTDVEIDTDAHAWDDGEITTAPTCTEKGVKTFTCTANGEHTYTVSIDALGHTEQTLAAKSATCTEKGLTAGAKCSVCDEILTAQTEIAATGHSYDNACDKFCNNCYAERAVDGHKDEGKDLICDECGAELERKKLPGAAVAAISVGATLAAEIGGFSLFWFIIKKKRFADLLRIFKK